MGNPSGEVFFQQDKNDSMSLTDGSRVAVIGGGPAGSFFSYFLLEMSEMMGLSIHIDIYEPKDFNKLAPQGCNMCGGIISESLVQYLATDGINLGSNVVQRGLDSYILHSDVGSVRIEAPSKEKRIAAVTRGPGPRDAKEIKWEGFDGYLQRKAIAKGACVIQERALELEYEAGKPVIITRKDRSEPYDLVAVAVGVNSPFTRSLEKLGIGYTPPKTTKTSICEYYFGGELIKQKLGNSMHVFLLNIPKLEFAAIIPKGDYATVCLLGEDINDEMIMRFLETKEFKECMPPGWEARKRSCNCQPRINIQAAEHPFGDRLVVIGDSGVARLYKDGIGAAYRTAKAAASTAIFQGVSAQDFQQYFMPACRRISQDNAIGKITFFITSLIQKFRFSRRAVLKMTLNEQLNPGKYQPMSMVMWDMFTGSAPYKEIFLRTLNPIFLVKMFWHIFTSLFSQSRIEYKSKPGNQAFDEILEG